MQKSAMTSPGASLLALDSDSTLQQETARGSLPFSTSLHEQPHKFTEKKSRLHGTVFWGPEVALPGKRDWNRTSNEINTLDVPHLLFVKGSIRLNKICQNFKDHIEDS